MIVPSDNTIPLSILKPNLYKNFVEYQKRKNKNKKTNDDKKEENENKEVYKPK